MKRFGGLLAALVILALWFVPVSAHADDEYIRHLDVTYDIQADGSVDVRWEVDWHFPDKNRHGIILDFASRESWDQDYSKDVVYELSNFRVSSPTGAPAQFEQSTEGYGSDEAESLRIGDPDVTLDTQDATYVVEYSMTGALRTFEGIPELYWDVNSPNLPSVRSFTGKVTGPEDITRARCLLGSTECDSEIVDGVATFAHEGGSGVTSVVAQLPPGSVANAEPVLQNRRLTGPELRGVDAVVDVQPDGSAVVNQQLRMEYPEGDTTQRVTMGVMLRMPWSREWDQVAEVVNLEVRDESGQLLEHELRPYGAKGSSTSRGEIQFRGGDSSSTPVQRTFDISYVLRGAVGVEGDTARLRIAVLPEDGYDLTDATVTWNLPAPVAEASCLRFTYYSGGLGSPCEFEGAVDGDTVTANPEWLATVRDLHATDFAFPASALTSTAPLQPSLELARSDREKLGTVLGGAGAAVAVGAAVAAARLGRRRDERYATVAPGVVGAAGVVRRASRNDNVPVQFSPPEILVSQAGLLRDRAFRPQHLAATLVSLASKGTVALSTKPLMVQRTGHLAKGVEQRVLSHATDDAKPLTDQAARKMRQGLETAAKAELKSSGWFQRDDSLSRHGLVFMVAFAPAVLYWLFYAFIQDPLPDGGFRIGVGLTLGGIVAHVLAKRLISKAQLTADGTVLLDQVRGFEQYIKTAEAHQLNFEADRDIFRRYLPWAVLFNLTDRWTEVCRSLAEEGVIDPPDTSFWVGAGSFSSFSREMSSFGRAVSNASAPPASSGGSGGSSGFSGGGGGGGGGGGTGGRSW